MGWVATVVDDDLLHPNTNNCFQLSCYLYHYTIVITIYIVNPDDNLSCTNNAIYIITMLQFYMSEVLNLNFSLCIS